MPVFITVPVNGSSEVWRRVCVCVFMCLCICRKPRTGENRWKTPDFGWAAFTVSVCAARQTLVMEARQFDDFWSFSGCVVVGSGMARKLKGSPILPVPMWPGLSAGFCRLLLSTMLDVLDARLSRVLCKQIQEDVSLKSHCKGNKNRS